MRRRGRARRWAAYAAVALVLTAASPLLPLYTIRWFAPPTSAFMLRARLAGEPVAYQWVGWDAISPHVKIAVVAAEDQKFPTHRGFDLVQIAEALEERMEGTRRRGASTISQQVVKNLFLWREPSLVRKGLEAYLTLLLEATWSKRRILEAYLNLAEFGHGVYGVEEASWRFFGKPASRLDPREGALLAAVLPSPRRMRADQPSEYVERRSRWIREQSNELGGPTYVRF